MFRQRGKIWHLPCAKPQPLESRKAQKAHNPKRARRRAQGLQEPRCAKDSWRGGYVALRQGAPLTGLVRLRAGCSGEATVRLRASFRKSNRSKQKISLQECRPYGWLMIPISGLQIGNYVPPMGLVVILTRGQAAGQGNVATG